MSTYPFGTDLGLVGYDQWKLRAPGDGPYDYRDEPEEDEDEEIEVAMGEDDWEEWLTLGADQP